MKLFKLPQIALCIGTLVASMLSHASPIVPPTYPPYPTPGTTPIYYGVYPVEVTVPYGKTASNPEEMELQFYIVNETSNTYKLSNFVLSVENAPSSNPIKVVSYRNDCHSTLNSNKAVPAGTCNIYAKIHAANNSGSPLKLDFKFNYNAGRGAATLKAKPFQVKFATGNPLTALNRTLTFVNHCHQDVWLGVSSGAIKAIKPVASIQPPDPQSCADTVNSSDCYPGSKCVQVQAAPNVLNHCLWENPAPTTGGADGNPFHLAALNASGPVTVTFPAYDNGIETIWNGGVAGRTGCVDSGSGACTIADCNASPSGDACPLANGFAPPVTQAEFTFLSRIPVITANSGQPAADTYDITLINGITVPVSMKPTTVLQMDPTKPYYCGAPGAPEQPGGYGLGNCIWGSANPPSADFVWVDNSDPGSVCPCSGEEVCGHSISGSTVSPLTCGLPLGYLTADAVCAIDKTFGAPFNCNTSFTENSASYTYTQVYGCSTGDFKNSCYSAGASSACCGCQDWGTYTTIPSSTQSCNGIDNSTWQALQITSGFLPWVKQTCPTAYSYPYDDASSTFTCQDLDSNYNNVTNYTITFCPLEPA